MHFGNPLVVWRSSKKSVIIFIRSYRQLLL